MIRDDRGVAALELGIFMSVLLLLAFGALPLYAMLRASQQVSKTSAGTLRYATSVAPNGRRASDGTLSRRPSFAQVQTFARDAAGDPDLEVVVTVCKGATCTDITSTSPGQNAPLPASAGDTVRLTVRKTVGMSVLGRLANVASQLSGGDDVFPENDTTVSSTASAREE